MDSRIRHDAGLGNQLTLAIGGSGLPFAFRPSHVVLAGYTGRDRDSVLRHIEELKEDGIPPPETVPALYPGQARGLQVGGALAAGGGWSSGEIEYVLFWAEAGTFVGVGSDHTDRELERTSIVASKHAFPKVVGQHVWPLESLRGEWDSLVLWSWVIRNGVRHLCQEGTLAILLPPADLIELIPAGDRTPGLVVFSGTVPASGRAPREGVWEFEGQLARPNGDVLAEVRYQYCASPKP